MWQDPRTASATPDLQTGPPRGPAVRRRRGPREPRPGPTTGARPARTGRGGARGVDVRGRRPAVGAVMTRQKQLKVRIRARMARTGESYSTARRHVAGAHTPAAPAPVEHGGYRLRGGASPVGAALAGVLAH